MERVKKRKESKHSSAFDDSKLAPKSTVESEEYLDESQEQKKRKRSGKSFNKSS
jgi:hypothetical protein